MAQTSVENIHTNSDKAKYAGSIALLIFAFVAYFVLGKMGQNSYVQWAVFVVGLVLAAVLFLVSLSGRRLIGFGQDAWKEAKKVVWPDRKEVFHLTLVVFGFALIMAIFLWLTDKTLEWMLYDLFLGWKK